jgi:hypothetical protein
MSADIIQFIPRPRHDRPTAFPAIPFVAPPQRDQILSTPPEQSSYVAPDKDPA